MKKLCAAAVGLALFAAAAGVQTTARAAIVTGAKLALVVDNHGAITRSKGVTSVTQETAGSGIFCVTPTTLNGKNIVPSVTVDQATSPGNTLFAYWVSDNRNCGLKDIEVLTGTGDFGGFTAANEGFSLLVP